MAKEVSIRIKINDNFRDVTVDAESLGKAIDQVSNSSRELASSFVKFASISQIAENAASAFGQLNDVMKGLTEAYSAQSIAETRLAQAMANTMGATAEEVQSIKDLCSAQQELGVIGDEVQLAAAQELATYLEYSDSLKAIIPVMNDMAAQQYGLGASAESVTQIATMLGKVMNGQTEALSRYGYKFDEAQKQILQFGTEAERAAVLVDVVGESVGGMNAALAKTPAGRMQQMANSFGDLKERIGQTVQSMMPFISGFNQIAQGVKTVVTLGSAFKALADSTAAAKVESLAMTVAQKTQAAAARLLGVSEGAAATATGILRVQIIALQAAMTLGLSLAITGVIELITRLIGRSRDAADAVEEMDEASEAFTNTSKEARSEIALYQVQLEDIIKHHKNDAQAVEELNQKYGESFGYYNTAQSWYDVLTQKSAAYCRQLGFEAQAKVIASQKAAKQLEQDAIKEKLMRMQAQGQGEQKRHFGLVHDSEGNVAGWGTEYRYENKEFASLVDQYEGLGEEMQNLDKKFETCVSNMASAQEELQSGIENISIAAGWEEMSLSQLTKAIQEQKGVVESLAGVDNEQAKAEANLLKQMQARADLLEGQYGLGSGSKGKSGGSSLTDDMKKYQEAVERAVAANHALGGSTSDVDAKLAAMKSGLTSLISKYGAEDEAIKTLISDYAKLNGNRTRIGDALPKLKDITPSVKEFTLERPAQEVKKFITEAEKIEGAQTAISALGSSFGSLSNIVGESAGAWLDWIGNLLNAISQAIPAIMSLVTAKKAEANANLEAASAGAASSVASIPYVGPIMAVAAVASVIAAMANIPKFAGGGVVYGPTLGLFGEYANAGSNPEVVAPVNTLTGIVADAVGGGGRVEFIIKGRDLYGTLEKYGSYLKRG